MHGATIKIKIRVINYQFACA